MSRYRIIEKPTVNWSGELTAIYIAQYKLWGLFWITLPDDRGYSANPWESGARQAIQIHKNKLAAKSCRARIIEIEDD